MVKNRIEIIRGPGKAPVVINSATGQVIRDYSKAVPADSQAGQAIAINNQREVERQIEVQKYGKLKDLSQEEYDAINKEATARIAAQQPPPPPRTTVIQASDIMSRTAKATQPQPGNMPRDYKAPVKLAGPVSYVDIKTGQPKQQMSYSDSRGNQLPGPINPILQRRNLNPLQKAQMGLPSPLNPVGMNYPQKKPGMFPSVSAADDYSNIPRRETPVPWYKYQGPLKIGKDQQPGQRRGVIPSLIIAGKNTIAQSPKASATIATLGVSVGASNKIPYVGTAAEVAFGLGTGVYLAFKAPVFGAEYEKARRTQKEQKLLQNNEPLFEMGQQSFLTAVSKGNKPGSFYDAPLPKGVPFIGGLSTRQLAYSLPLVQPFAIGKRAEKQAKEIGIGLEKQYPGKYTSEEKDLITSRIIARTQYESLGGTYATFTAEGAANSFVKRYLGPNLLSKAALTTEKLLPKQVLTRIGIRSGVGSLAESIPTVGSQQAMTTQPKMTKGQIAASIGFGAVTSSTINLGIGYGAVYKKPWITKVSAATGQFIDPVAETGGDLLSEFTVFIQKKLRMPYEEVSLVTGIGKENKAIFAKQRRGSFVVVNPQTGQVQSTQTTAKTEGTIRGVVMENPAKVTSMGNYLASLIKNNNPNKNKNNVGKGKGTGPKIYTFDDLISPNPIPEPEPTPIKTPEPNPTPQSIWSIEPDNTKEPQPVPENEKENQNQKSSQTVPVEVPLQSTSFTNVFTGGGFIPPLPFGFPTSGAGGSGRKQRAAYFDELSFAGSLLKGFGIVREKPLPKKTKKSKKAAKMNAAFGITKQRTKRMTPWQILR